MGMPVNRTVMVVDIESFSSRSDPVQRSLRAAMGEVVREAVLEANLPWTSFTRYDRGDGLLILIDPAVSPVSLAGDLVRTLASGLTEKAGMYSAEHRMRFRVALHQGVASEDADGWSGEAVNLAARLVDIQPLRDTLAAAERAGLALVVSDAFHATVVRPGHRSLDPSTFLPVPVELKNMGRGTAWIAVPGYPAPPGLRSQGPVDTGPPDRPAPDAGGDGRAAGPVFSGTFHSGGGTQVVGDQHGGIHVSGSQYVQGDAVAGSKTVYKGHEPG